MRELLFRGKDRTGILNHSWLYGSLDNCNEDFPTIMYKDRWGNTIYADVLIKTVGQFTGLTDKNGKKIFEGDIVKCLHTHRLLEEKVLARKKPRRSYGLKLVKREDPIYRLYSGDKDLYDLTYFRNYVVKADIVRQKTRLQNGSDTHYLSASYVSNHEIEVIGNIHDNPELLEVNNG